MWSDVSERSTIKVLLLSEVCPASTVCRRLLFYYIQSVALQTNDNLKDIEYTMCSKIKTERRIS